ncbi:MAG: hypothetical protein JWQ08_1891 [Deinococcus sp.]|nr:hypothetical protein [Deinococcus sp.]
MDVWPGARPEGLCLFGALAPLDQLQLRLVDPDNAQGSRLARTLAATLPPERQAAFLARWLTLRPAPGETGDSA